MHISQQGGHCKRQKKRAERVILMIYILLGFTFPQYNIFSLRHNQKRKRNNETKTTTTHTYNLIWKPHIHTVHPPE